MTETPPPSAPLPEASGQKLRELQQFLLYLGSALTAFGEAVNQVEEHLRRVAAAYGGPPRTCQRAADLSGGGAGAWAPGDAGADPPAPRRAPARSDGGVVRGAEGS